MSSEDEADEQKGKSNAEEEQHKKHASDTLTSEQSDDSESIVDLGTPKRNIDCINLEPEETEDSSSVSPVSLDNQNDSGIESDNS